MTKTQTWEQVCKIDPKKHLGLKRSDAEKQMIAAIRKWEANKKKEDAKAAKAAQPVAKPAAPAPVKPPVKVAAPKQPSPPTAVSEDPTDVVIRTIEEKMQGCRKGTPRYSNLERRRAEILANKK